MKAFFSVLTILSLIFSTALAGPRRGGGDPRAIDFIKISKDIAAYLMTNDHPDILINAANLIQEIDLLERSLDTDGPRLRFTSAEEITGCVGGDKLACATVLEDTRLDIVVAGKNWDNYSKAKKCELTAMELFFKYIGEYRYNKALAVCQRMATIDISPATNELESKIAASQVKLQSLLRSRVLLQPINGFTYVQKNYLHLVKNLGENYFAPAVTLLWGDKAYGMSNGLSRDGLFYVVTTTGHHDGYALEFYEMVDVSKYFITIAKNEFQIYHDLVEDLIGIIGQIGSENPKYSRIIKKYIEVRNRVISQKTAITLNPSRLYAGNEKGPIVLRLIEDNDVDSLKLSIE